MEQRTEDVLRLICGVTTAAELAEKHGVTPDEVEAWRAEYVTALGRLAQPRSRSRRWAAPVMLAATGLAVLIGLGSSDAWAQSCPQTLPSPMVTFCPDAPALASQVNGNLSQLVTWVQQKVGTVGTANVTTTGTVTSNGPVSVNNTLNVSGNSTLGGSLSFGARTGQHQNLWNTGYGIGIQNSTLYMRSDSNFAWHRGGTHSDNTNDPGAGGLNTAVLDTNGTFYTAGGIYAAGELGAGSLRQRSCNWGTAGPATNADGLYHAVFCPAGSYAAGWRCYANTYLDGACQMYCCYP